MNKKLRVLIALLLCVGLCISLTPIVSAEDLETLNSNDQNFTNWDTIPNQNQKSMLSSYNKTRYYTRESSNYNATLAANYAKRWCNSYNPEWYNFDPEGGDCTNFVSQCLYVGGMTMTSGWYWNSRQSYSGSWTIAHDLANYLSSRGYNLIVNPSVAQVSIGDVLSYDWNADGRWDHSAICVGSEGNTRYVCAHSEAAGPDYTYWTMGAPRYAVIQLYGSTSAPNYTISYNANGGTRVPSSQTKTHGSSLTLSSEEPTRDRGYGSYTVTLNANGGSVSPTSMSATNIISYSFYRWNTKPDGSGVSYAPGDVYSANENAVLYAQWQYSKALSSINLPTPTRVGYLFKGWATNINASSGVTGNYTPYNNETLYAIWEKNNSALDRAKLNISLSKRLPSGAFFMNLRWNKVEGADLYEIYRCSEGEAWKAISPLQESTQFYDSNISVGNTYRYYVRSLSNDLSLYSDSVIVEKKFTPYYVVLFNANDGTGALEDQYKSPGTNLTISTNIPTRENANAGSYTVTLDANGGNVSPSSLSAARTTSYTFKNWNTEANGSGKSYAPGTTYSADADLILYAQWNSSTSTAAVTLPTPTRSGHSFLGWGTSSSAASGVTGSYTPTGNVTFYAIWEPLKPDFILPASLITIEEEAFTGGAFTYVKLPETTGEIQSRAFADCPNLAYIYIPEATSTIAKDAFSGVSGLAIVGVSDSYAEFFAQRNGFTFIPIA